MRNYAEVGYRPSLICSIRTLWIADGEHEDTLYAYNFYELLQQPADLTFIQHRIVGGEFYRAEPLFASVEVGLEPMTSPEITNAMFVP